MVPKAVPMQIILNIVVPVAAVAYLASTAWLPYPGHPLVKAVPILLLAAVVLARAGRSRANLMLGAGLLVSAGGDVVLATSIPQHFVIGLSLFFVAHVLYSISFHARPRVRLRERWLPLSPVLLVVVAMAALVLPRVGPLLVPVAAYMLAITMMGVFAAVQREEAFLLYTGAVSFICSDSIIAVNKFVAPIPGSGMLIMITYYLAQALLARGALKASTHQAGEARQG